MAEHRVFDVIVVGLGGMGSAACLELARRGRRVLGLERFVVGHGRGSSHGGSRIIRECYFEHADYVPLLLACREGWDRLERESGERLVHRCGLLYASGPGGMVVRNSFENGRRHGVACERWTATEAMRRFPQFQLPSDWEALFEPAAGFVRPERAVEAAVRRARHLGAQIREGVRVANWSEQGGGVRVSTSEGEFHAGSLLLTAGAWTPGLAADPGVSLQPQRVVIAWLQPREWSACTSERMPAWYLDRPGSSGLYGIPTAADQGEPDGVKVAGHGDGTPVDPERVPAAMPGELEALRAATDTFLPCAAGSAQAGTTCLYTMSPDGHFVVDRMTGCLHTFVACGFSGHGFKFAPVMGRALADLACHGETALPIGFLSAGRFARAS